MPVAIPLADVADAWLGDLERASGSRALAAFDGATLLGERAVLGGFGIPTRISAGGGCRLYDARSGAIALNLARPEDRGLLPALFGIDGDPPSGDAIAAQIALRRADELVARGRLLGLAIAHDDEAPAAPCTLLTRAFRAPPPGRAPRVLDLCALWAGPLAAHLLQLAGADVTRVESRTRPETVRDGDGAFFALLNEGKAGIALDLRDPAGRAALLELIAAADIVIEAARPRALEQLGIHAADLVRAQPGLSWITITGHGAAGDAAHWVGFGDDCGVAGGLTAALRRAGGGTGFVGDAIGDPLTGIYAARTAWEAWTAGGGVRLGIAMSGTVAAAIEAARGQDAAAFDRALVAWRAAAGGPFPPVRRRTAAATAPRSAAC